MMNGPAPMNDPSELGHGHDLMIATAESPAIASAAAVAVARFAARNIRKPGRLIVVVALVGAHI